MISFQHVVTIAMGFMISACVGGGTAETPNLQSTEAAEARALLVARNQEFQQDIIQVSEHVYTAVGFGLSPVSMIVGTDGIVIIDTNLDVNAGERVLTEFRKVTDRPIKAIIFTHGHADHTGGAAAFLEHGTEVWARAPFHAEDEPLEEAGLTIQQQRGFRQFGVFVPEDGITHVGVGARYFPQPALTADDADDPVHPTHTFRGESVTLNTAGLSLELVAANGETNDQLFVWYEADRVLFSGDNFYKSWPNLYAIRGTGYRDVRAWINSLSMMLDKRPRHLVGGHTRPILGEADVTKVLTNYRDAVKYVFDKTIEGMNKGLTPDQLVAYSELPERYRNLDYLRPYYGHPDWGVRSIFTGYLGWFDGNPTNLFPLAPEQRSRKVMELAGGRGELERAMIAARDSGQYQWALELVDHLLHLSPDDRSLMRTKAGLLDHMAEQVLNVTARNYYRSYALELRTRADKD